MSEILSHFLPKRVRPRGLHLDEKLELKMWATPFSDEEKNQIDMDSYGNFVTNQEAHLRWRNAAKRPKCIAP